MTLNEAGLGKPTRARTSNWLICQVSPAGTTKSSAASAEEGGLSVRFAETIALPRLLLYWSSSTTLGAAGRVSFAGEPDRLLTTAGSGAEACLLSGGAGFIPPSTITGF